MSQPIAVPAATAARISGYLRQQQDLNVAVQTAVATAAEMLDVPPGYQYDPEAGAFVPPAAQPAAAPEAILPTPTAALEGGAQ